MPDCKETIANLNIVGGKTRKKPEDYEYNVALSHINSSASQAVTDQLAFICL